MHTALLVFVMKRNFRTIGRSVLLTFAIQKHCLITRSEGGLMKEVFTCHSNPVSISREIHLSLHSR